jgi:hypothetical protein
MIFSENRLPFFRIVLERLIAPAAAKLSPAAPEI